MKLSIEEKAKAYDEAIKKIKGYVVDEFGCTRIKVADVFPELKESEDEQHSKWILEYLYDGLRKSDEQFKGHFKSAITWLENLGETFTKKDVDDAYLKGVSDAKQELEKQGEQNTIIVIPKFRVGDVIRPKGSTAEYTIESISGECYHGKGWGLYISCDDDYELVEQKPAIKLERDENGEPVLTPFESELFSMMSDAWQGYMSGEEVNIAKIVKEHSIELLERANEQKPAAWSEEDKRKISRIYSILRQAADTHAYSTTCRLIGDKESVELQDFLNSLRPQNTWRPSDAQIASLSIARDRNDRIGFDLTQLLRDLKKLKK